MRNRPARCGCSTAFLFGHSLRHIAVNIRAVTALKVAITVLESTTTRTAGGLDFTATGGKRQGREVPQSLRVEPGAKHPVWKTQLSADRPV
jgi:hypothetical protein